MKHTPILLLTLVAAAASAAPGDVGLNYNRVSVGYLASDAMKGFSVGGTAELANSGVLISGSYSDVDGKGDLDGLGGYMTGFGLAYKFNVGSGDLAVGLGYQRVRTNIGGLVAVGGVIFGDVASENDNIFNVGLRYNLSKNLDLSLTYAFTGESAGGDALGLSVGYSF